MTAQQKIDKVLGIIDLEINEFAIECKIIPNSLKAAIKRDALTDDIVKKIHDKFGVRKGFFKDGKDPVMDPNITPVQKRSDNKEKSLDDLLTDALKGMTSDTGEYYMVPKAVFEGNYRFVPVEEFEMRERELEMRERELARKHDDLVRKDTQIQGLYDLFRMALAGRNIPDLPKTEEGQKNATV